MTDGAAPQVEAAAEFARGYLHEHAEGWEQKHGAPRSLFERAAAAELTGLLIPAAQGGQGVSYSSLMRIVEALAYTDFAATFALIVHNNHVRAIASAGTKEQIARWLPDMLSGKTVGAFLLTEPKGGSDAAQIETSARADGTAYILSGEKAWVTNAAHADLLNVFAQTVPGSGARGIASFQIPADSPGVERIPSYEILGAYAMNAGGFRFHDVRVEANQLLVPPGDGFKAALAGIDIARAVVAGMCCGMLQSCLDVVVPRLSKRTAFGAPLIAQQGLAWQLADVSTDLAASRLLAAEAARLIDTGASAAMVAAQAKKFATEVALRDVAVCMQAMGADGLKQAYPFARHLAAAKIAQYIDGTTEIQNLVIGRALVDQYRDR
jgi:alkylation response protein AidB-like acyl-CoA dehydrogenase